MVWVSVAGLFVICILAAFGLVYTCCFTDWFVIALICYLNLLCWVWCLFAFVVV